MIRDRGYNAHYYDFLVKYEAEWRQVGYSGPFVSTMAEDEPGTLDILTRFIQQLRFQGRDNILLGLWQNVIPHLTNGTCMIIRMHNQSNKMNGIETDDLRKYIAEANLSYGVPMVGGTTYNMRCRKLVLVLNAFQHGAGYNEIRNANVAYANEATKQSVSSIDLFFFSDLRINPTKHFLVPKFQPLTAEETAELVQEASRAERKKLNLTTFGATLHKVFTSDTLAKWFDVPSGSVVLVKATNVTSPLGGELVDYQWVTLDSRTKEDKDKEKKYEKKAKLKTKKGITPQ